MPITRYVLGKLFDITLFPRSIWDDLYKIIRAYALILSINKTIHTLF